MMGFGTGAPGECIMPTATEIAKSKKIAVDFPSSLYEETEKAISEMHTTRSAFVRTAVAYYIHDMRRKKMEEELAAGYMANAICAQRVAEELMGAEGDLV